MHLRTKFSFLAVVFVLLCGTLESKELQFIHKKTGKVTSFRTGDDIGFKLKRAFLGLGDTGELTDFNQTHIRVDEQWYEIALLSHIRHFKPRLDLLLSIIAFGSLLIAAFLGVPLLLPIPDKNFGLFLVFLSLYVGSLITKEIINGPKIKTDLHFVKTINDEGTDHLLQQNP